MMAHAAKHLKSENKKKEDKSCLFLPVSEIPLPIVYPNPPTINIAITHPRSDDPQPHKLIASICSRLSIGRPTAPQTHR